MKVIRLRAMFVQAVAVCITLTIASAATAQAVSDNWHQWRGPDATGVSKTAKPPLEWSESKNIQWKTAIPGNGTSCPIVWGDDVFLLTAIDTKKEDPSLPRPEDQPKTNFFDIKKPNTTYQFVTMCLDRNSGKEKWRHIAAELIPHDGVHKDNNYASSSPMIAGERLYCWFGSAGMVCYDLKGNVIWKRDLGTVNVGSSLGEGCSPVIYDGKVVIVRDNLPKTSSIEVLDAETGNTLWKKKRDEGNAWATPRILEHSGRTQVITVASNFVRSYDLDSGEVIWKCSGMTGNCTPCPVVMGDYVYTMSGYKGYSLMAIPLTETGDISDSDKIRWTKSSGTPYVPSPVLYDGRLYYSQSNQAILTVTDAKTGDPVIKRSRLSGMNNIYASPVAADGRVYITGRNGMTLVLKQGDGLDILAENKLDERIDASAALAGNQLFLRGRKSLYCIAEE